MNTSLRSLLSTPKSDSERLRLIAIGSADWIIQTIHHLHHLRFAEAGDWSPLLPVSNSKDLMSILTRQCARS